MRSMISENFAQLALQNLRPTKIVDGKVYTYLTTVYTEKEKRQIKDELQRKHVLHRFEIIMKKDIILGYEIFIL